MHKDLKYCKDRGLAQESLEKGLYYCRNAAQCEHKTKILYGLFCKRSPFVEDSIKEVVKDDKGKSKTE